MRLLQLGGCATGDRDAEQLVDFVCILIGQVDDPRGIGADLKRLGGGEVSRLLVLY